ncbi:MAG: hypothetical protein Q7R39_03695, partial [Dehalococcoidia bacterium]|nr:hypothetical protein [Dehalococcoidia bacterium]
SERGDWYDWVTGLDSRLHGNDKSPMDPACLPEIVGADDTAVGPYADGPSASSYARRASSA